MAPILVVDDDPAILQVLIDMVTDTGHTVFAATDYTQALHIVDNIPVSMVILHIWMPYVEGYKLFEEIRSHQRLQNVPVVIVSAIEIDMARISKATAFIPKPIDLQVLEQLLRSLH